MTRQEIVNVVYKGLKAQGFQRSVSGNEVIGFDCKYRGDNGRKCSIGHLIPDGKYFPELEGCAPAVDVRIYSNSATQVRATEFNALLHSIGIGVEDFILLRDLQMCHDRFSDPARMKRELELKITSYGLKIPG